MKVLIVEDERDLRDLICYTVEEAGYEVDSAVSGNEAWLKIQARRPDLALMDLNLPGRDGLDVIKQVRSDPRYEDMGIIALTARDQEQDIVAGLEAGADDYVCKPFRAPELLARIASLQRRLRRTGQPENEQIKCAGVFVLDRDAHSIRGSDGTLALSPTEYAILALLIERAGRLVERGEVIREVWGEDENIGSRTVDAYVTRIRGKAGRDSIAIVNVRGHGYRLQT